MLATLSGSTTTYHLTDHLSARATTDASGNVIGQQGHYPYGESWYASSSTTKWQFTSYERDAESGNDYAMARYDVNRLGRFSSPDLMAGSIADPQSLNRYAYTLNDPENLTDPLGLNEDSGKPRGSSVTCSIMGQEVDCKLASWLLESGGAYVCSGPDCNLYEPQQDGRLHEFVWHPPIHQDTVAHPCANGGICTSVGYKPGYAFDNLIWPTFDTFIWPTLRPL